MEDGKTSNHSMSSEHSEFLRLKVEPQRVRFLTMSTKERITQAREAKGFSKGELARRLGISRSAVSQWESGATSPDGENLLNCAAELEVSPDWIQFGEEGPPTTVSQKSYISAKFKTLPVPEMSQISKWMANPVIDETYKVKKMYLDEDISNTAFLHEVTSNAMINLREIDKSIFPGEIAVIDPNLKPNPSNFVLVEFGTEDYRIRRYERDGKVEYVEAYNTAPSEQKVVVKGKIKIIGVVLKTYRDRLAK